VRSTSDFDWVALKPPRIYFDCISPLLVIPLGLFFATEVLFCMEGDVDCKSARQVYLADSMKQSLPQKKARPILTLPLPIVVYERLANNVCVRICPNQRYKVTKLRRNFVREPRRIHETKLIQLALLCPQNTPELNGK
jgi:hypothetical protein